MFYPFSRRNKQLRHKCAEWFLVHRHLLMGFTLRQVDDMTDAEHLLSAVMGKVITVCVKKDLPQAEWLPYTYAAIRNAAIRQKHKNNKRKEAEHSYGQMVPCAPFVFPAPEEKEIHKELRQMLGILNPLSQCIVRMKIWDELTVAEIARQLNMPESTVRARYRNALEQLRKKISEDQV